MHSVVVVPFPSPNKAMLFERLHDLNRNSVLVCNLVGFFRCAAPTPIVGILDIDIDCGGVGAVFDYVVVAIVTIGMDGAQSIDRAGTAMVDMLLRAAAGGKVGPVQLPTELVLRESHNQLRLLVELFFALPLIQHNYWWMISN